MRTIKADVAIVGGGPAGAASALHLLDRGITPVIVEREQFPRFHIGESMTGECGNLVREFGFNDQMLAAGHPVKHGVVVSGAKGNPDWWIPMSRRDENLDLQLSPTWSVRRATFDKMLLDAALEKGAELVPGRASSPLLGDDGRLVGVEVGVNGGGVRIEAPITLDCSGQATFLANRKVTGPKHLGAYDKQIAIFSHVTGYQRDPASDEPNRQPGNTHIYYTKKYHWAWAIPVDDDVTSIGIVVPAAYFRQTGESKRDFYVRELHELNPGLDSRLVGEQLVEGVHVIPNYSFQVGTFAGPGYICVGDAHRFVDPIFSFGLYCALQESVMAVDAATGYLDQGAPGGPGVFREYMIKAEKGIDVLEDMIDTFWENPLAFSVMVHRKYRDPMTDVFSGRIYEGMPNVGRDDAMAAFRKLLKRERTYDDDKLFSVPIGSRFHAERAPLWNSELDSVETTESWIRDNA